MRQSLQNSFIFLGIFLILSAPALLVHKKTVPVQAKLIVPGSKRVLASTPSLSSKNCEMAKRWRWSCENKSGEAPVCQKDKQIIYKKCLPQ